MNINRVAVIGECMIELQKYEALYKPTFGGDTLNTALYLSRLIKAKGITVSYLTGLGKDPFSKQMLQAWQVENINTEFVAISENKLPGLYTIETTASGERSFYYWRNDSAAKYWLRDYTLTQLITMFSQHQLIYLSGISLAILPQDCRDILINVLTQCKKENIMIAFDNNYRPSLWESVDIARDMYTKIMRLANLVFLTFDDEKALYGDENEQQSIQRAQKNNVAEIVIKRGENDTYVITPNEFIIANVTKVSQVVDTTAAGDSFSAGYLAKRLTGGTIKEAALTGNTLAGTVIQYPGAIIPIHAMPSFKANKNK